MATQPLRPVCAYQANPRIRTRARTCMTSPNSLSRFSLPIMTPKFMARPLGSRYSPDSRLLPAANSSVMNTWEVTAAVEAEVGLQIPAQPKPNPMQKSEEESVVDNGVALDSSPHPRNAPSSQLPGGGVRSTGGDWAGPGAGVAGNGWQTRQQQRRNLSESALPQ